MPGHLVRVTLLLLVLLPPAGVHPLFAQTAADLFDPTVLQEIRLFMNSRDVQQLHERYQDRTHYTVDLAWRSSRIRNAAVRSRGTGSANPIKPGLRIEFDRYTTGQRFLGLRTLVLDNLWQDPAMIREHLAMAMFTRLGQPAPLQSFCRLFINNQYQGVYAVTEEPGAEFVARTLAETGGYVFEYHWLRPFYAEDPGDDLASYVPLFEPRTHALEAESTLYRPIRELFRQANQPDDAVWRERVEQYLDLSQFITYAAIETFVGEDDGVLGYAGMNNFYLYRPAGSTVHRLFPWDKDNAFHLIDKPVLDRAGENVLFRRALAYPDLRDRYFQVLEDCARRAADGDWLATEIERQASLIGAAAREDPLKQFSNEEFDRQIEFLREFAAIRSAFVLGEVAALRQADGAPQPGAGRGKVQDRILRWPTRKSSPPPDPNRVRSPSSDD
jgi:spore coat protein CotH